MTEQEAFNKVWEHFVANKQPRSVKGSSCAYRGDNGTKCAVGVLIPDVLYDPNAENVLVISNSNPIIARWMQGPLNGLSGSFLWALQQAHDNNVKFKDIKEGLIEVAKQCNLQIPSEVIPVAQEEPICLS